MVRAPTVLVAVAALLLGLSGPARATTMVPLSPSDMMTLSDLVVTATVEDVEVERMPGDVLIRTVATLRVEEVVKGSAAVGERVHVRWIGGELDGEVTELAAVARYAPGERVLAFLELRGDPEGLYRTVGMRQGKFTRVLEVDTGRDILVKITVPRGLRSFDEAAVEVPAFRFYADDLLDRLRAELAEGIVPPYRPIPGVTAEKDEEFFRRALGAGQAIDPRLLERREGSER